MVTVAVLANAGRMLGPIVRALVASGMTPVIVGDREPADLAKTGAEDEAAIGSAARVPGPFQQKAEVAARLADLAARGLEPDAYLFGAALSPPSKHKLRRAMGRADRAMDDDDAWAESQENNLELPWRWTTAVVRALLARGAGSLTLLLPASTRMDVLPPDEAAWREALSTMIRVTAMYTQSSSICVNAVTLSPTSAPGPLAQLLAVLSSPGAGGHHGQILAAREP